jgi:hypothetical protein
MSTDVPEECAASIFRVEDEGSTYLPKYMASHPRKQYLQDA